MTNGFYSDALLPEEVPIFYQIKVGNIDDEIRMARIQFLRVAKQLMKRAALANGAPENPDVAIQFLELAEVSIDRASGDKAGAAQQKGRRTLTFKDTDLRGHFERLVALIANLEAKRASMHQQAPPDADELRRRLREDLLAMRAATAPQAPAGTVTASTTTVTTTTMSVGDVVPREAVAARSSGASITAAPAAEKSESAPDKASGKKDARQFPGISDEDAAIAALKNPKRILPPFPTARQE